MRIANTILSLKPVGLIALAVITTLLSTSFASAQCATGDCGGTFSDQGAYAGQVVGGDYFDATTKFDSNARRPLGGLFAPDFTRTLSFFGGWNAINEFGTGPAIDPDSAFDDDFAFGVAYGRRHSQFMRSEFEFTYRNNDRAGLTAGPTLLPAPPNFDGVEAYSLMKNFLLELNGNQNRLTPYLGIGIGYAYVDPNFSTVSGASADGGGAFAYQPIAGVSFDATQKADLFFEYRYFRTAELESVDLALPGQQINSNYDAHNLFFGVRFEF